MGGIVKAVVGVVKSVVKAVTNVVTGFLGMFGMSFDTPDFAGGESYEASQQGITVNKQSNVAGIPVVYGRRKVGGVRVFAGTSGSDNKYLYVALAVAEGQINAFKNITINDELQTGMANTLVADNQSLHNVRNGSKFYVNGSKAVFQFFTGQEDQSASSLLKEHPQWTDSHRLRGIAYVAARYEWVKADYDNDGNQTVFNPWQGFPTIQVEIEGRKVLTGDYSSHATTTDNTYGSEIGSFAYSDNPADCLLDYLRNPRYGKDLHDHRIDWASFRTAQQLCDTSADFGGSLGSADFLNCNTFLKTEDKMFDNAKKLLQSCRGFLPYVNGQYQLKIETAESTPSNLLELTDAKIIGSIKIAGQDKNTKYNQAKVTFNNKEKDYESDTAIFSSSTFLTEDGGEDLVLNIGAPSITERERALQYAEYMVKRSREQLSVTLTATTEAQDLVAGDLVTITHRYERPADATGTAVNDFLFKAPSSASYSAPEMIFRVVSQKLNYDGTVDLQLLQHQNDIYTVTQQQEDRDLSPIQTPPITPGPTPPPSNPTPPQISGKHFTVTPFETTIFGKPGVQLNINNNDFQSVDAFAVKILYNISVGNNRQQFETSLPNKFGSSFTNINGRFFQFGDSVEVNISSVYQSGQTNPIESHIITMPAQSTATASGSI